MTDLSADYRQRLAAAIESDFHESVCGDGPCITSFASDAVRLADAVLAVGNEEVERLRAELAEATATLTELAPLSLGVRAEKAEAAISRVRRLSHLTINGSIRVQAIQQAQDTLAALDEDWTEPEGVAEILARAEEIEAAIRGVACVRRLHREFKIYGECGHRHHLDDWESGVAGVRLVAEVGLVCEDGYLYSVCRECCAPGEVGQNRECAENHDHKADGWECNTLAALDGTDQPKQED